MESYCLSSLLVDEIHDLYLQLRKRGKSRTESLNEIRAQYSAELYDQDERISVLIGMSLILCKKKELTNSVASETLTEISRIREIAQISPSDNLYLARIERLLTDETMKGNEASYRKSKRYVPDWKVGDTFSHTLTYPKASSLGIYGWSVLFYKVGEYTDSSQNCLQLMYVSICAPGEEPKTSEQLESLGFLRVMNHDDKWDYLVQLVFKSKKDELSYGLSKIGNFPNIASPSDSTKENPLYAMPLFGYLQKGAVWPNYEDQICRLYKKYKRE